MNQPVPDPNTVDAVMYDAIEHSRWQDLADALNRLSACNIDVIAGFCEGLGRKPVPVVDAGVHHGGTIREGGYLLRYVPPFTPDPDRPGHDLPFGWTVKPRTAA